MRNLFKSKKWISTIVLILTCSHFATAQRLVLVEHFTGENCGPCAAKNPAFESLMNSGTNPSKAVQITWMENIPYSSVAYFFKSGENMFNYRMLNFYYWVNGGTLVAPSLIVDGDIFDKAGPSPWGVLDDFTQTVIDTESAVAAPFRIKAYNSFNTARDSVTVHVTVTCLSNYSGTPHLRIAWVKNMNFSKAPGTNGEKKFENVVRDMFPSPSGGPATGTYTGVYTSMPSPSGPSWVAGDSQQYSISGKVKGLDTFTNVTSNDSMAVVWIQDDAIVHYGNRSVLQAALSRDTATHHDTTSTSSVAAIQNGQMSIYPNPSTGIIKVQLSNHTDLRDAAYALYNTTGELIRDGAMNAEGNINLNDIAHGQYILQINLKQERYSQVISLVK